MKGVKLFLFSSLCFLAHAIAREDIKELPLSDRVSELSAIVGYINVVTGTIVYNDVDIVMPGTETIQFQRFYFPGYYNHDKLVPKFLRMDWMHNHHCYLKKKEEIVNHVKYKSFMYFDMGNGSATYFTHFNTNFNRPYTLWYDTNADSNRWITNSGLGIFSGQTHPKNIKFHKNAEVHLPNEHLFNLNFENFVIHATTGSGTKKELFTSSSKFSTISKEIKPNGNTLQYAYKKHELSKVTYKNADETTEFGSLSFCKNRSQMELETSDKRKVIYRFRKGHGRNYYLEHVIRPNAPQITYEYLPNVPMDDRLRRWHLPEGRFTEFVYYSPWDRNQEGPKNKSQREHWDYFNKQHDFRVKNIMEPLESYNPSPIVAYTFDYDIYVKKVNKDFEISCGITHVRNALNFKTSYYYDQDQRLNRIEKYTVDQQLYSAINSYWIAAGDYKGFLHGRNIQKPDGSIICAHMYNYDADGNLSLDRFLGNLTGTCPNPIQYNDTTPLSQNTEIYDHIYIYSKDGFNLLLTEIEEQIITKYQYKPNTNLLTAKFICENDQIRQREFYTYDKNATLIQTIADDGTTESPSDLTNVTQRLITNITPKSETPCLGLPITIEEKYLDLTSMEEKLLRKTDKTYTLEGWLLSEQITDANQQFCCKKEWTYNQHGKPITYKDPQGYTTHYTYDLNDNCTSELTPKTQKLFTYDYCNRRVKEEYLIGNDRLVTTTLFDRLHRPVQTKDIYGNPTTHYYNEFDQPIQTYYPATTAGGILITRGFDLLGNVFVEYDNSNTVIRKTYNVRGQPVTITHPDGRIETTVYNLDGTINKKTQPNGTYTQYTYDYQKRPTQEITYDKNGNHLKTVTQTYNAYNLLTKTTPDGQTTTFQYDYAGRKIGEICGDSETHFQYDSLSRIATITKVYGYAPNETTTQHFTYDNLDRVVEEQTQDFQGNIYKKIGYVYDSEGNKIQTINYNDQGPCITTIDYNSLKQPTHITDPQGNETRITYNYRHQNSLGQFVLRTTKTDPLGNQIITTFNALGKEEFIEQKNPFGITTGKIQTQYDMKGNVIQITHAVISPQETHDFIVKYEYDICSRLTRIIEAPNTSEEKITTHIYNSYGQKETTIQPNGIHISHTYDALGRLSTLTAPGIEYQYTYDQNDNLIQVKDPSGVTSRHYDLNNYLIQEQFPNGLTLNYQYDRIGRPTQVILPDQSTVHYQYNAAYLTTVTHDKYTHTYQYNLSGQVTQEKLIGNCGVNTWTYDKLQRPLAQCNSYYQEENTTYDPVGNLLTIRKKNKDYTYTYDDRYQLTSEPGNTYTHDTLHNRRTKNEKQYILNALNQITSDGTNTYEYDSNGNMVHAGNTQYQYDSLNRLIAVITPDTQTQYTYDAFNRRLQKKTLQNGTWTTYRYIYQGHNETGCYIEDTLTELRILGHGKGAEIGASIGIILNNIPHAPIHDHNGNIIALINADTGTLTEEYDYTAFGEEEQTNYINPWRFSSKRYDPETGLVYFGRRYYNSTLGRWVTPDPKGFDAGPNLYAYVLNSPLTHYDEYGLDFTKFNQSYRKNDFWSRSSFTYGASWLLGGNATEVVNRNGHVYARKYVTVPKDRYRRRCPGQHIPECVSYTLARPELADNMRCSYGNGINNTLEDNRESAGSISQSLGETNVHPLYIPSGGLIPDLWNTFLELLGFRTDAVMATYHHLRNLYESIKHCENPIITHYCHSRHGASFDIARRMLPDYIKKRMIVYTFGSIKMIPKDEFLHCENICSSNDFIPKIGRLIMPGFYSQDKYNITIIKASEGVPEHSFLSNTYQRSVKTIGRRFGDDESE